MLSCSMFLDCLAVISADVTRVVMLSRSDWSVRVLRICPDPFLLPSPYIPL